MSRLSPVNFSQQSQAFLDAAAREFNESPHAISIPAYFLVGRALELAFKSFLLVHGATEKKLRKLGHDLDRGLEAAVEAGLGDLLEIEDQDRAAIFGLNRYYVSKDLEYVRTGYKSYPEPRIVLATARRLLSGIAPAVRAWRPED